MPIDDRCYTGALPSGASPTYPLGTGPWIRIDQTHLNTHTVSRGYLGFKKLLSSDGYQVAGFTNAYSNACGSIIANCDQVGDPNYCLYCRALAETRILVVVNPRDPIGSTDPLPEPDREDELLADWLASGGRLLLVLDHCPYPSNAVPLLQKFADGDPQTPDEWSGDTIETDNLEPPPGGWLSNVSGQFYGVTQSGNGTTDGTIATDPITQGRGLSEIVSHAEYFRGTTFNLANATPILRVPDCAKAYTESEECKLVGGAAAAGWMPFGQGRVVFGGDGAMFSANCHDTPLGCDCSKEGMQPQLGNQNEQLALNVVHWLDDFLPVPCPGTSSCEVGCEPDLETCLTMSTGGSFCAQPIGVFTCGGGAGPFSNVTMETCPCSCEGGIFQGFGCQ